MIVAVVGITQVLAGSKAKVYGSGSDSDLVGEASEELNLKVRAFRDPDISVHFLR